MCSIDDIELTMKDEHSVWSVDEDGEMLEFKETYSMESYPAYFSCDNCGEEWNIPEGQQKQVFEKVKEHLNDN